MISVYNVVQLSTVLSKTVVFITVSGCLIADVCS